MRLLEVSFDSPLKNLALDEALLDCVEENASDETLRLWESPVPFAVLGVSQQLRQHVHEKSCKEAGVRIYRRASAGGCVLQGQGCLNFSLALNHEKRPEIRTIRGSYCYILGRICDVLNARGIPAKHKGTSDIAVRGKKVSGNAQKRRRRAILHHGTLLYRVDTALMEKCLLEPVERPGYRGERTHSGFVRPLPLSCGELREALLEAFPCKARVTTPMRHEVAEMQHLVKEKYSQLDWIRRR